MYQVSQISRPFTAVTVRFLKMRDSAMSIVAGCEGMPKSTTFPLCRTISNASWIAFSAPDISKTMPHADALVLRGEPPGHVVDLPHVDDVLRAELLRELEPEGHVVGREQASGAERPEDRDREEPDRPATEHRDRTPGEVLRRRREDGVAERLLQAGEVAAAASSRSFRQITEAGMAAKSAKPPSRSTPRICVRSHMCARPVRQWKHTPQVTWLSAET